MTDTLYFLFLDEIYTPNLNEFRKRTKEEIFLQENHHHYTATLNKKENFDRFKNNYQKYRAYTDSLKSFVINSRFKFSCVFVDKHELIKKYGRHLLISFYNFISNRQHPARRIILDLFIVPKTQDYVGTQLADMIVYPVYDSEVPNHSARKDHFINFDKVLKRKLLEEVKVIP